MKRFNVNFRTRIGLIALVWALALIPGYTKANESDSYYSEPKTTAAIDTVVVDERNKNVEDLMVVSESLGGMDIYSYLRKNIQYPAEAADKGIEGYVKVFFRVEKDGSLKDITPVESNDDVFAAEVVSALRKATVQPVIQNGYPASYTLLLPITFQLLR
jgi:TonB family protein